MSFQMNAPSASRAATSALIALCIASRTAAISSAGISSTGFLRIAPGSETRTASGTLPFSIFWRASR